MVAGFRDCLNRTASDTRTTPLSTPSSPLPTPYSLLQSFHDFRSDGMFGNQTMQQTIAFNAVRSTGDNGPVNTWGRAPYVTFAAPAQNRLNASLPAVNGDIPESPTAHPSWSHFLGNLLLTNYHSVWPLDQGERMPHCKLSPKSI